MKFRGMANGILFDWMVKKGREYVDNYNQWWIWVLTGNSSTTTSLQLRKLVCDVLKTSIAPHTHSSNHSKATFNLKKKQQNRNQFSPWFGTIQLVSHQVFKWSAANIKMIKIAIHTFIWPIWCMWLCECVCVHRNIGRTCFCSHTAHSQLGCNNSRTKYENIKNAIYRWTFATLCVWMRQAKFFNRKKEHHGQQRHSTCRTTKK